MLRHATVLAATLAAAVALAACGASTVSNNATTARGPGKSAALKLAHCMRTHGVPEFPDPAHGGGFGIQASLGSSGGSVSVDGRALSVSAPAFRKAMQDCRRYAPQGRPISGAQLARIKQGALKMARCMRTHGVPHFPDPQITTGPGGVGIAVSMGGPSSGIDPRAPAFQKAQRTCQSLTGFGPKQQTVGG